MTRTPVLVGVGAEVRRDDELPGLDHLGLMTAAAEQALADAGVAAERIDVVLVPHGLWPTRDPGRVIAERLGARGAHTILAEVGVSQLSIVRRACQLIADGDARTVLLVGGEARHREGVARRAGVTLPAPADVDRDPDEYMRPDADLMAQAEAKRRLNAAPPQYAVIEKAMRAAEGRSVDDHQAVLGQLWADFAAIAATNPDAWDQSAPSAEHIAHPGPGNRVVAWPYTKLLCSQWNVDQAAAMVFSAEPTTSTPIYPRGITESNFILTMSMRRDLHRWPAFAVAAERLFALTGLSIDDVGPVDLYSCFPAAVQTAAGELGLALDRPLTVTGGMTFGGGPLNNYVFQAIVTMARRLRAEPGVGLTTAVSGLLTKPSLALWSTEPGEFAWADVSADAEAATPQLPLDADATGEGTVAGYTVFHDGEEPAVASAVIDVGGTRTVAVCEDAKTAQAMTESEWVGAPVRVTDAGVFAS